MREKNAKTAQTRQELDLGKIAYEAGLVGVDPKTLKAEFEKLAAKLLKK